MPAWAVVMLRRYAAVRPTASRLVVTVSPAFAARAMSVCSVRRKGDPKDLEKRTVKVGDRLVDTMLPNSPVEKLNIFGRAVPNEAVNLAVEGKSTGEVNVNSMLFADVVPKPTAAVETVRAISTDIEDKEKHRSTPATKVDREIKPTPTPVSNVDHVESVKQTPDVSNVDRQISQQYEMAKAIPKTGFITRVKDRWGLTIDLTASESEQKRQRTTRNTKIGGIFVFIWIASSFVSFCIYYSVPRDEHGNVVRDEFTGQAFAAIYRIKKSFIAWRDYVVEPSREKLLPDPLPPGYIQPKYTIVIEMKNVLVSPEWTYKTGHRFKLRPALEYFLDVVGYPNFEVVIYTSESSMTADPVITTFDPKQRIMYRLFRDCTKYHNGAHIKDLSRLNRDLTKVIHIDFDPTSFSMHPENVLRVPKWEGNMNDTALIDLAELLKTIHLSDVEDVRPVLEYYSQFDDPAKEFRRRAEYMAEQDAKQKEQLDHTDSSLLKRYSGRLFGFRRHASA